MGDGRQSMLPREALEHLHEALNMCPGAISVTLTWSQNGQSYSTTLTADDQEP
jgi:hypothetical protein